MDVLEHWQPKLDWSLFHQGALSADVWASFSGLVTLCHAFKHWKELVREHDTHLSRPDPFYKESAYAKQKRIDQHKLQKSRLECHMYRAAFLAAGQIRKILELVQQRNSIPDFTLIAALIETVGPQVVANTVSGHESARFELIALNEFDATVIYGDPIAVANRWRSTARDNDDI